jgi:hypothetical protein
MAKRKHIQNMRMTTTTGRLADNHTWHAPDGYKIFVADRGAVSFNFPHTWLLKKFEPVEIHDGEPPDDNARISMSYWRLPPGVDWTGLPLAPMLEDGVDTPKHEILHKGRVITVAREDIELCWIEQLFMDPVEHRPAFSRNLVARGFNVQVLITFDYWQDHAPQMTPVWDEIVRSLQLGRVIKDPLKGATLH